MSGPVALVGAGMIGQSWAITFARAGHPVRLFDRDHEVALDALGVLVRSIRRLADNGLLADQDPASVAERITAAHSLAEAVKDVIHVQENTSENLNIKIGIFAELDAATPETVTLASSTSALLPSQFADGLAGAHRCLVAHPLNPPHLIPVVELVPSPATSPETMQRTTDLMLGIGQTPIAATREIEGFVMNRLQGALLDEAFNLVSDGLASVEDIDAAIRDGLARRWVFMGPFETIDLNAPGGVGDFIDRYGPAYSRIGAHRPNRAPWEGKLRERIVAAHEGRDRAERARLRDARLAALARFLANEKE